MHVLPPQRRSGQLWLEQHNAAYGSWLQSGFTNEAELLRSVRALRFLLEREPLCAPLVATLAAVLGFQHASALPPGAARELADIGVLAAASLPQDPESLLLRAWLLTDRGRAELGADAEAIAAGTAAEALALLAGAGDEPAEFIAFATARASSVQGDARQALLDLAGRETCTGRSKRSWARCSTTPSGSRRSSCNC